MHHPLDMDLIKEIHALENRKMIYHYQMKTSAPANFDKLMKQNTRLYVKGRFLNQSRRAGN